MHPTADTHLVINLRGAARRVMPGVMLLRFCQRICLTPCAMKVVLDIATILGGIAALIFFWDRFSSLRRRVIQRVASQQLPPAGRLQISSLEKHQIPTIVFCFISGVALGIVGGNYGY